MQSTFDFQHPDKVITQPGKTIFVYVCSICKTETRILGNCYNGSNCVPPVGGGTCYQCSLNAKQQTLDAIKCLGRAWKSLMSNRNKYPPSWLRLMAEPIKEAICDLKNSL